MPSSFKDSILTNGEISDGNNTAHILGDRKNNRIYLELGKEEKQNPQGRFLEANIAFTDSQTSLNKVLADFKWLMTLNKKYPEHYKEMYNSVNELQGSASTCNQLHDKIMLLLNKTITTDTTANTYVESMQKYLQSHHHPNIEHDALSNMITQYEAAVKNFQELCPDVQKALEQFLSFDRADMPQKRQYRKKLEKVQRSIERFKDTMPDDQYQRLQEFVKQCEERIQPEFIGPRPWTKRLQPQLWSQNLLSNEELKQLHHLLTSGDHSQSGEQQWKNDLQNLQRLQKSHIEDRRKELSVKLAPVIATVGAAGIAGITLGA